MKILVYLPIDTLVKAWARRLEADGHEVRTTHSFAEFRRRSAWADWILMNSAKFDSPKYVWKILISLVLARLKRRRVAIFYSIDLVDLCDRPLPRAVLWCINRIAIRCPEVVAVLDTRDHIVRRYGVPADRVFLVSNCPDRERFSPVDRVTDPQRPLTFFYHGELLWWHGLERFIPIFDEIKKRRPARLIVTGTFYPTVFRVFGIPASRKEAAIKAELATIFERDDVEYRGRVEEARLRELMAESDFHLTLFNDQDLQARTELRTCLLEAMAAGMACLHAATPALRPGLFRDGENIVVVGPGDPTAAAEKILAFADSPDRLDSIRRAAVQTIEERFDFETLYGRLLARIAQDKGDGRRGE